MMRILQIFGEPLSFGGQESFIMNIYECIDKSKIQFDFFSPYYCDNEKLKKRIEDLGGNVYVSNKDFESKKRKLYFIDELTKFLNKNKYDYVHINSGSTFALAYGAEIAKKCGVKMVIVHSHCDGLMSLKYRIVKFFSKKRFKKYVDIYLACSDKAANWKFPEDVIKNKNYIVIKNGIQLDKFKYNSEIRNEYRTVLNYNDNDFVLGNVGRMENEKNQIFLIDVFYEVLKKNQNAKLLLIGTGSLKEKIENKINELKIKDKVTIMEKRNDINNILQAMDVFVFPSLYEGLGIAAIEAQASGLRVYASENVPESANITNIFTNINIDNGAEFWANEILKKQENTIPRVDITEQIEKNGFNAQESARELEKIYIEMEKK